MSAPITHQATIKFDIIREIGQEGKNSQVFLARDLHLNAEIVIKRVPKAKLDKDQFFNESQLLHISSHPNVVPIRYACETEEYIFLALPYYPQGSIKRLMSQRFLTMRQVVRLAINFLSGLQNIHSKRLSTPLPK